MDSNVDGRLPDICTVPGCELPRLAKGMCAKHYQRARYGRPLNGKPRFSFCTVEGCAKSVRSGHSPYCEMHYGQIRRNGHIGPTIRPRIIDHSDGYKLLGAPGHPLATKGQPYRIYEHRAVYYEHHGGGPFLCFHCGVEVNWGTMHVDHLNGKRDDNRIENLVASCPTCNQARGHEKVRRTMRDKFSPKLQFMGREQTLRDWADELGIKAHIIKWRLDKGWSVERALSQPVGPTGPKSGKISKRHHDAKTERERGNASN